MKYLFLGIIFSLGFNAQALKKSEIKNVKHQHAGVTKVVTVNGMVCAFCSNSIEKKFKKQKSVESVDVDLESKIVTINFKPKKDLSDKKIKKLIKGSGFDVVSIKNKKIKKSNDKG